MMASAYIHRAILREDTENIEMRYFMQKKIVILVLCFAFVLVGCQSAREAVEGGAATGVAPLPTLKAIVTSQSTQASSLPSDTVTETSPVTVAKCAVVTSQLTPDATEQALFPAVSDADWIQGADTAAVTFIEYGDFQ